MTSRERVLAALSHREPDVLPIDLGGTDVTSILAPAYARLRRRLGCATGAIRLIMPDQFLPEIEPPVLDFARADCLPIWFPAQGWVSSRLLSNEECVVPVEMAPERVEEGRWAIRGAGGGISAVWSEGGSSFRSVTAPLAGAETVDDLVRHQAVISSLDAPGYASEDYQALAKVARDSRRNSDRALVLHLGGHILAGGQSLMGYEKFMTDILLNPRLVEALLDRITETHIERVEKYAQAVGDNVDVVYISDDLGAQNAPQLDPRLYRKIIKPRQAELCKAIRRKFNAFLMLHTDGAVSEFIPDFIEMGIQALNPVQVSAAGMEPAKLKREFGKDIAFWGGGCEGQRVLPFGTPEEVADEVKRRIDQLAPGGGFVFSHIHNMQPETPAENVVALYEAAHRASAT